MRGRETLRSLAAFDTCSPSPEPTIVFDEQDLVHNMRFALELNDVRAGVLTVDVTPGNASYGLANDVLAALSKRYDITGKSNTTYEAWFRACAWVVSEDLHDIVVCRAHLLNRFRWERLIELAAIAEARLWLLVHRPSLSRAQREAARDWGMRTIPFPDFRRLWRRASQNDHPRRSPRRLDPAVPDEEFPTFLKNTERLLEPEDYRWVSKIYRDALARTRSWFEKQRGAGVPVTETAIAEFLHSLLADARGLSVLLVRARAAQAAAFGSGWLVKVNQAALAGAYFAAPLSRLDEDACSALRMYGHPRYAAAAVISLASHEPPTRLVQLDLQDVHKDGSAVRFDQRTVNIPEPARGIVRAQLAFRLAEGADETEPLFASEKRSPEGRNGRMFGRTTPHGLHQRLAKVAIDTGLSVIAAEPSGHADATRWLRRQGVTVHRIPKRRVRS